MTKKTVDSHGSWRYLVVGFDISNEDFAIITKRAIDEGLSVSAYVVKSFATKALNVQKNQKMYGSLLPYWNIVLAELDRLGVKEDEYESF